MTEKTNDRCRAYVEALCRRADLYYAEWSASAVDPTPLRYPAAPSQPQAA